MGAVHVGVLRALEEAGIKISIISGTSVGAIVAALYAFGKTPREIEDIVVEFEWKKLSNMVFSRFGLLSNEKIGDIIKEHIGGDKEFKEAKIPLAVVATDITSGQKAVLQNGSVAKAVMASTAIPGVFVPVEIQGNMLIDGGIMENIPIGSLKDKGADFLIGVDLICEHPSKKPQNVIEILYNSFNLLIKANKELQTKDADLIIKPDLSKFNAIDMSQIRELIKVGYNETEKTLKAYM